MSRRQRAAGGRERYAPADRPLIERMADLIQDLQEARRGVDPRHEPAGHQELVEKIAIAQELANQITDDEPEFPIGEWIDFTRGQLWSINDRKRGAS